MRVVFWVFFVVALIYGAFWLFTDDIRNWFFPNIVEVKVYGEAQIDSVRIDWTSEVTEDTLTVFKDRKQITEDFRGLGYNEFLFYYNNQLVGSFEQFKRTKSSGNHYSFLFWKKADSLQVDLKITGPEAPL